MLFKALDLPALAPVAQASMPTLPGLQSPVAKASPQRTPAKKAPTPGDGPGCPYSFSRGQYKGQICGAKVAPGETYCNACKEKECRWLSSLHSSFWSIKRSWSGELPPRFNPRHWMWWNFRKRIGIRILITTSSFNIC